jgi:Leucine-rich repeat (LRR) protein
MPEKLENLTEVFILELGNAGWRAEDRFGPSLRHLITDVKISDFCLIENSHKLEYLKCTIGDNVGGIDVLKELTSLKSLSLVLRAAGNLDWIKALAKVKYLDLDNVKDCQLGPVYDLQEIENLQISDAEFVELPAIAKNSQLKSLELGNTSVESVLPSFKDMSNFRLLVLRNVRGLRDVSSLKEVSKSFRAYLLNCPDLDRSSAVGLGDNVVIG